MFTDRIALRLRRRIPVVAVMAAVALATVPLLAQGDKYIARLGWVPIANVAAQASVSGKGSATATLSGTKLAISGTFEALPAPATLARLHRGIVKGARGPAIGDLTITKAAKGTISGSFSLTSDQVESLKEGKLYVQIHSEKGMEDGSTLWGWLSK